MKRIKNNILFSIFIFFTLLYLIVWFVCEKRVVINSDGSFYYLYFVRLFIEHNFIGSGLIKYPVGTALLQLPFLLFGLVTAKLLGIPLDEGMTQSFQISVYVAAVFYGLLGLTILYILLKEKYSKKASTLACVCIMWGTMLPEYMTHRASFSHAYGFFLCCLFMYYIINYEKKYDDISLYKKIVADLFLGVLLGMIAIIRNTDIIIGFIYFFYRVSSFSGFLKRLKRIFAPKIIIQILGFSGVYAIQIICWRLQTGKIIIYSYGNEAFDHLKNPQIMNVLFSDAKGLFIFSPILIIGMIGMIIGRKDNKEFRIAQWVIFILQTYIVAAWWCWWLGAAYGERMFCDILCIFAIPFASFFEQLELLPRTKDECGREGYRKGVYIVIYILVCIFILMNFIWINGCRNGIIDDNLATWFMLRKQIMQVIFK